MRKVRVVSGWQRAKKCPSLWYTVLGTVLMGVDFLDKTWRWLPQDIQAQIPNASTVGMVLFVLAMVSRLCVIELGDISYGCQED